MATPCTYIDGIGTSQAIDTAGEVVDLKGIDISSLVGGAFNWEHLKDVPAQIVGKILEATKIFSKEDCTNERHLYFWNKCQMPFLYVMGRLFDDRKPSAVEVAALFKDDAAHPHEQPMLGFSVEGSRLGDKKGMLVPRSIARKITITNLPANKTCVAGILPEKRGSNNSLDSIFKGEMELFKFEPSYGDILEKKEKLNKAAAPPPPPPPSSPPPPVTAAGIQAGFNGALGFGKKEKEMKKDVGSGGGAFIGSQLAMSEDLSAYGLEKSDIHSKGWSKPNVSRSKLGSDVTFNHPKHGTVSISKHPKGHFEVKHNANVTGSFKTPSEAGSHAKTYMMARSEDLTKALEAGSSMVAPGQLSGGAVLAPEDLKGKKKIEKEMKKAEKSHWYERAGQAYDTWDKKNHFKSYMKKKMPHLAEGEIDAIGKVLALKKTIKAEGKLSKMYASYFNKGEPKKD